MVNRIKRKLMNVHHIFLESIKDYIIGEFLVGSCVYAKEKYLSNRTDLDIVCIVKKDKLPYFLNSKYLKGLIEPNIALEVLEKKLSDYLVLKTNLQGVLLSIDVISPSFFKKMCNLDLCAQNRTYVSYKYGNEPQYNKYSVSEFNGKIHIVQKESREYKRGHIIKLPLFFISSRGHYIYGIPTIKCITHKIYYDSQRIIENNIFSLIKNLIQRLKVEYPSLSRKKYCEYFLNILKGSNKFPVDYKKKILNTINLLLDMESLKEKINKIREEVYKLFKKDTGERKYLYTRRDWIFPNHLDIMIDLARSMCKRYGGDEIVCELAVLLHDTGLVYKRESSSPEGHEKRSLEYASNMLKKYKFPKKIISEVLTCIETTDKNKKPKNINEKIVKTADVLSQFISVHYFAKASFFGDWKFFYKWLKDRVENCYKKIYFEKERKIAKPIRDYILNAIKLYEKNKKRYPLKLNEENKENEVLQDN